MYAAEKAKEYGAIISYDPNYRANLWQNESIAAERMKEPLGLTDILKVSDNELPLLAGTDDLEVGTKILSDMGIRLIFVTLGANGVFYRFGDITGSVKAEKVKAADTNGAGDSFFGAALSKLCRLESLSRLNENELRSICAFANKAAGITTSRHGAIPAMPTLIEMQ